jgi:hypothetical protein
LKQLVVYFYYSNHLKQFQFFVCILRQILLRDNAGVDVRGSKRERDSETDLDESMDMESSPQINGVNVGLTNGKGITKTNEKVLVNGYSSSAEMKGHSDDDNDHHMRDDSDDEIAKDILSKNNKHNVVTSNGKRRDGMTPFRPNNRDVDLLFNTKCECAFNLL